MIYIAYLYFFRHFQVYDSSNSSTLNMTSKQRAWIEACSLIGKNLMQLGFYTFLQG